MSRKTSSIDAAFDAAEILSGPASDAELMRPRRDIVDELNREWSFVLMGSKAVIMREARNAPVQDSARMLSLEAFAAHMANQSCIVESYEDKHGKRVAVPKYAKKAQLWLTSEHRRSYDGVEFFPDPENAPGRHGYFNLWRGFNVTPDFATPAGERARKYSIFRDHLENHICAGNREHFNWVFAWFAWILQRPRHRVGTSIVLRGDQGTGKTVIGDVIGNMFEANYFLVDDPRYLVGQFNAHLASCLLLQIDEGFWAGDKAAEGRLKGLITAKKQMIEKKGVDPIQIDNRVNVMFSSNESWVVPAGMGERRHAVFDVADHVKENHGYFQELYAQIENGGREALLADLLEYDLDAPGAGNPRVIPKTKGLLEQKIRSFDPVTQWWYARLGERAQTQRSGAWRLFVPVTTLHSDYLRTAEKLGVRRKASLTEFGLRMKELVKGLKKKRRTEEVDDFDEQGRVTTTRRQVNCYAFPALAECRELFEALLHQEVDWDDGAADDGESAGSSAETANRDEEPVEY